MAQQHKLGKTGTKVVGNMESGELTVFYHGTPVVEYRRGTVTLNTAGYFTNTTKTRMNQAANQFGIPFRVFQRDHIWHVDTPNGVKTFEGRSLTIKV